MAEPHEVTAILQEWRAGNRAASDRLFPLVYDELRRQARRHLSRERNDHTLQPTALVHEAFLKIVDQTSPVIENRVHFFAFASRIMRQILVDHAREHKAAKRGGAAQRLSVDDLDLLPEEGAADMLELDDALRKLETIDERKSQVVDMRFFGGLKESEIADVLGVNE